MDYNAEYATFALPKNLVMEQWLDWLMIRGWLQGRTQECFSRTVDGRFLAGTELAVYQAGYLRGKHGNSLDQPIYA